ncbi:MAG: glycosyltransferase [Butyrivibrio sp.]|nr:glycosyltransferase [Butyrivibrio sp.]
MYEQLKEYIVQNEYKKALYELQEEYLCLQEKSDEEAANLFILEATLWEALADSAAEFDAIQKGLYYDNTNYELYYMLGLYFININVNWAYLCMEMALFYCKDEDDHAVIESSFEEIKNRKGIRVKNTSIMILSYNDLGLVKECIASIEEQLPKGSFEIVVVDNSSTEKGVIEYLREKRDNADYDFKLIESSENLGFPKGCNLGANACRKENDILFLNNDAVLTPLSLFWLRMGLYDSRNVGATGPLSNSASLQEVDISEFADLIPEDISEKAKAEDVKWHKLMPFSEALEIFKEYSSRRSVPLDIPYQRAFRLTGFALLLSRNAIREIEEDGCIFDESFSPGYFEDDDLGIRLAKAGFEQYICLNSFVYHNGGSGFEGHNNAMEAGRERFRAKWGFDVWGYCLPLEEACEKVLEEAKKHKRPLRVIDFSCGFGANAAYLKEKCKGIFVAGVCRTSEEAGIAGLIADECIYGDPNTIRLPWPDHTFDVVIADSEYVSRGQAGRCLAPGGLWFGDPGEQKYGMINYNHDTRRIVDELPEL